MRRAGATGPLTVRVDSGFWSNDTITTLDRLNVRYTMAVRCGVTTVARGDRRHRRGRRGSTSTTPPAGRPRSPTPPTPPAAATDRSRRRLVVRRTRLTDTAQQRLWPDWRHHAFLTDLDGDAVSVDAFHRHHAVVELAIRDLKEGAGLDHVPSGNFHANSAWLQCAVLAHNLIRWTAIIGDVRVDDELTVARTMRTRLITLPGRLVNRSGIPTLRLPDRWPWATTFNTALRHATRPRPRTRIATDPRTGAPPHHHQAPTSPNPTKHPISSRPTTRRCAVTDPRSGPQPPPTRFPAHHRRSPKPDRWIEA